MGRLDTFGARNGPFLSASTLQRSTLRFAMVYWILYVCFQVDKLCLPFIHPYGMSDLFNTDLRPAVRPRLPYKCSIF